MHFLMVAHQQGHKVNIIAENPYTPAGEPARTSLIHRRRKPWSSFSMFLNLIWRPA